MIDTLISKLGIPVIGIALLCTFLGVTIDNGEINVKNSFTVKQATQTSSCIENVQRCMDNPPSFEMFGMKIG